MMARLKAFVSGLSTGALIATGAALWIGTAEGCRHHKDAELRAQPVEALPTERSERWERITEICPSGPVQIVRVEEREAERVEERYGLLAGESDRYRILGENDLPRMEWGGSGLSALDDTGRLVVTVKPNPEPLLEITARWSFYAEGAFTLHEQDGEVNSGKRFAAGAQYEALRFARIHLEPFAEAGWRERAGSYAEAGVRLSLRVR